jgi:hypothetical protein
MTTIPTMDEKRLHELHLSMKIYGISERYALWEVEGQGEQVSMPWESRQRMQDRPDLPRARMTMLNVLEVLRRRR